MSASDILATARVQTVIGTGGCRLHVRDYGPQDSAPIVFLHGLLMTGSVWHHQVSALAGTHRIVTVDLRGHGSSDVPEDASYSSSETWADDLHAVFEALGPRRPVLVAWSYAGLIVADYLRHHGDDALAGLVLVAPLRKIGTDEAFGLLDSDFLALVEGLLSPEVTVSRTATAEFIDLIRSDPWPADERSQRLSNAMAVPPAIRGTMLARDVDNDSVWEQASKPVMVAHGSRDRIITPASTEKLGDLVPNAQDRRYDGAGHTPFVEQPDAFNRDLRAFADTCFGG